MRRVYSGFTMLEMIIMLGILALILSVALPSYVNIRNRSRDEKRVAELGIIAQALDRYKLECKTYPTSGSNSKLNTAANNGLPGVNGGICPGNITLAKFLPAGFTPEPSILYDALVLPAQVYSGGTSRCTSYHLGVQMISSTSGPLKRIASRSWKFGPESDSTTSLGTYHWKSCTNGSSVSTFPLDYYDLVAPAPY